MNEASANAHSLYSVVLMPAASAAASLCLIAAQARPGLVLMCASTSANITIAMITEKR